MTLSSYPRLRIGHAHAPLLMHWDEDQLRPVVALLDPFVPTGVSDRMRLATASVARDLVLDHLIGGGGVHYSRKKSRYGTDRYRRKSDPLYSYTLIVGAMNHLRNAGLIEHTLGDRLTWWQSHARAFAPLVELLSPVIDPLEPRGSWHIETIVLRDEDGNDQDYADTPETEAMRDELGVINKYLARLDLRHHGQLVHVPIVRRVFNETFSRGGRLYCAGESYQSHPGYQRRELTSIIDGEAHPVVEIDYSSLHPRMAYAKAGKRLPMGDPYTIEGFSRDLVKTSFNTVVNAPTRQSAVNAIAYHNRGLSKTEAEDLVTAITRKHYRIKESLYSDAGAQFQRTDSDMAVEILLRMIRYTGRCPLVMHDSFLVADIDADTLADTMEEVARDWGLDLELKDSRGPKADTQTRTTPTTTHHRDLSTMGVTSPDLRVSSASTTPNKAPPTPSLLVIPTQARQNFQETHPPPPEIETHPLYGEFTTPAPTDSFVFRESDFTSDWATNSFLARLDAGRAREAIGAADLGILSLDGKGPLEWQSEGKASGIPRPPFAQISRQSG